MDNRPLDINLKWIWAGFFLGVLAAAALRIDYFFDDAYIHARLAENLLTYGAPYFNPDTPYKAGSSTGYVLLIAALSVFFDAAYAILYVEIFVIIATMTGLFTLVSLSPSHRLRNALAALCVIPSLLTSAYGGMETSIMCLLITVAAISWRYQNHTLVVFFIALAAWFRIEAIALLVFALYYFWHNQKKVLAWYAFPLALLFLTDLFFFGTFLPAAVKAKVTGYDFPLDQIIVKALSFGGGAAGVFIGVGLVLLALYRAGGVLYWRLKMDFADVFLLFSLSLLAGWIINRFPMSDWYPCLAIVPLGIAVLVTDDYPKGKTKKTLIDTLLLLLALAGFLGAQDIATPAFDNRRVSRYIEIGRELYDLCPDCILATSEIGGLGYSFKGRIYDAFGLGDPEALQFHPLSVPDQRQHYGTGAIPPKYVEYRNPDLIVSMPAFSEALRKSAVIKKYKSYDCFFDRHIGLIFGDDKIQIFSKMNIPAASLRAMRCRKTHPKE